MKYETIFAARQLVGQMPRGQAKRLRRILSIPNNPAQRRRLIVASGLPIGALQVAAAFDDLRTEYRRAA